MNKLINYVLLPFTQWLDYKGKTTIKDFWLGLLSIFAVAFALALALVLNEFQFNQNETIKVVLGAIFGVFIIYWLIAFYALQARRLNDRNTSKWWLLLVPITNITFIAIAVIGAESVAALAMLIKFGVAIYYLYLLSTKAAT